MCIICIDMAKGTLTSKEARRALGEMAVKLDSQHIEELKKKIAEEDKKHPGQ